MDQLSNAGDVARTPSGRFPKSRLAVSGLFLVNGFIVGSWAPKIPVFAEHLELSESALGLMILLFGVGSLLLMPVAGAQIARLGSTAVVKITGILLVPMLLLITLAGNIWTGAVAMVLFGGFTGAMDVAMNANAVEVERSLRRAIMSSCHAFWSLGGLIGAVSGGFLLSMIGPMGHAIVLTAAAYAVLALCWPYIQHDAPHPEAVKTKVRLPMTPLPWLIGIVALFSMVPEGAILDWGALYVRQELGASVAMSGLAFGAFSLTMAVMRFAGDLVRDRLGAVRTIRICTVTAMIGMLISGFAPNALVATIGFAIAGIGISNMVPIAFSAAGNLPGMAQGIGLSVVTTMGYSGILFAPSIIGFISEHTGFAAIYATLPVLFLVVLALSHLARYADSIR
ncbi:MFS transporter [Rhizobiaceae bacterium n13]|uniref:MFS transporter n=1 Tax=Ferirhizobium litorale TaxID=2927786 RepID=A0AAE3QFU4_9HYPH|nr:MFS transporter [Fererhizobium litorale]MDI7864852.1 MFS transporter [Fererhizobium litorale]MDI7923138.1 MFS transporter [Fererhizobium litorale]